MRGWGERGKKQSNVSACSKARRKSRNIRPMQALQHDGSWREDGVAGGLI